MIINTNVAALNTFNALNKNTSAMNQALSELSTGKKINSAADDPSGLTISEQMQGQINGLTQANSNTQNGISLIQTAEGGLTQTSSILQTMRELAVQASNGTNTTEDLQAIQDQINQYTQQIDNIGNTTQFNTINLLNGGAGLQTNFTSMTVGGVATPWLQVTGGTTATNVGAINVTAATKATGASSTTTVVATAGAESFTLNGHTLTYNALGGAGNSTADAATVAGLINQSSNLVGATATAAAGVLTITNTDLGSTSTQVLSAAAGGLTAAQIVGTPTYGSDATITGANLTGNYVASGNTINVTQGTFSGLQLSLNGALMGVANLATGSITGNGVLTLQIGANQNQNMNVSISDMRSAALGVNALSLTSSTGAQNAISTIDSAISTVSAQNSTLGAYQDRLQYTSDNLTAASQNLTTANSTLTNVDMASEMSQYTQDSILVQAATSMLAQANQEPQTVLKLLQ
jgi:flagellin